MIKLKILLCMLVATSTYAGEVTPNKVRITTIESRSSANHDIYFDQFLPGLSGTTCSEPGIRAKLNSNHEGGKEMFATALAALMSDKDVKILIDGCTGTLPNIQKVQIYP